jgi:topoisomerase-4 subunit A
MDEEDENLDPDADKSEQQIRDELTGQTSLNFDEE